MRAQEVAFRFSLLVCGHAEDAEDVMQDALLKTYRYVGRIRDPEAFRTWLYRTVQERVSDEAPAPRRRAAASGVGGAGERARRPPRRSHRRRGPRAAVRTRLAINAWLGDRLRAALKTASAGLSRHRRAARDGRPVDAGGRGGHGHLGGQRQDAAASRARAAQGAIGGRVSEDPDNDCARLLQQVSEYLDQELDAATCSVIEAHCRECQDCAGVVEGLRRTVGLCREPRGRPLPAAVKAKAQEAIRRLLAERRP